MLILRISFNRPLPFFRASLAFFELFVAVVGVRCFTGRITFFKRKVNFSTVSCLFCHWLRDSCETTRRQPAESSFENSFVLKSSLVLGSREEPCTSKINSTRVETLLTFCPPGPPLLENRNCKSDKGI